MKSSDTTHVPAMTRYAWDLVCHERDFRGLQMALYLSMAMATRLKVEMLTEIPAEENLSFRFLA